MHAPLILPERTIVHSTAGSKRAVITELASLLHTLDPDQVLEAIMAREQLGSTGIGYGVAIPHCRIAGLTHPIIALARHPEGVDFDSIDGEPVHLVVMLLVPEESPSAHLELLARLARLLQKEDFRRKLMQCEDAQAMAECFREEGFSLDG